MYFQFRHLCKGFLLYRYRFFIRNLLARSEKNRLWKGYKTTILYSIDNDVVKNLSIFNDGFSKNIIDIALT